MYLYEYCTWIDSQDRKRESPEGHPNNPFEAPHLSWSSHLWHWLWDSILFPKTYAALLSVSCYAFVFFTCYVLGTYWDWFEWVQFLQIWYTVSVCVWEYWRLNQGLQTEPHGQPFYFLFCDRILLHHKLSKWGQSTRLTDVWHHSWLGTLCGFKIKIFCI